jgi:hypothetical protein
MDEDLFWQIIESFDWAYEGYDVNVMEPAVNLLSQMTEDDLRQFDEILAEKLYALDTQAHGRAVGFGIDYFSVDSFLYTRCAVVINGRSFYDQVLKNPHDMPKDLSFESVLSLADDAAEKMGLEDYWHDTRVSYETFSNEEGWKDAHFPSGLPPGHKPLHQRDNDS